MNTFVAETGRSNTGSPSADTPKLEFPDAFARWWFQTHLLMATDTRQPGLLNDSVEQGLRRTWQEPGLFHLIISGTLFMCGATCYCIYLTIAYISFDLLITLTGVHGKGWKSHCIRFHRSEQLERPETAWGPITRKRWKNHGACAPQSSVSLQ